MAKKEKVEIAIDVKIENLEGAKSIGALKDGIKDLTKALEKLPEGSAEFNKISKAVGNAKDKLADMNEEIVQTTTKAGKFQAVTGVLSQFAAGIGVAQSAMALFGSESESVKKALEKAQAAMQFVGAIKELEGIVDAFKNFKTVVVDFGKTAIGWLQRLWVTMLSNPITAILVAVAALGAAIVYFMNQEDDETAALKRNIRAREDSLDAIKKENEEINKAAKFRVDLLKAQGATEKEVLDAEKKNAETRVEQLNQDIRNRYRYIQELKKLVAQADGDEKKELEKKLKDNNELLKKNQEEILAIQRETQIKTAQFDTNERKKQEEAQKAADEKAAAAAAERRKKRDEEEAKRKEEKRLADLKAKDETLQGEQDLLDQLIAFDEAAAGESERIKRIEEENKAYEEAFKIRESLRIAEEQAEAEKAARQKLRVEAGVQLTVDALNLTQAIVAEFAGKDEASQRKAFEINKKVQLALATIEMIKGVQSAFTSAQASPFTAVFPGYPYVQAGLAAAYGLMNIRKISQTKFEGGGGAGGGMAEAGGGGGAMSAPLSQGVNNTSTNLSNLAQGQQEQKPIKAYVLQTDVASEDQKMKAIENKAKIE